MRMKILKTAELVVLNNLQFNNIGLLIKTDALEKEIMNKAQLLYICSSNHDYYAIYKRERIEGKTYSYFVKYDVKNDKLNTGHVV